MSHSHSHPETSCTHAPPTAYSQDLTELQFERSLHGGAHRGDLERVRALLKKSNVDDRDTVGYTALHYASRQGHQDVCKALMDAGADPNARTKGLQTTPLHRAALADHVAIISMLLKNRADPTLRDSDGRTALDLVKGDEARKLLETALAGR
ncbi:Ankyrin repeat domain-containing protein 39 [Borealophlyctis nickersoniae]|nr:Ankyrin repeat domain-containing protein 39 [Borealophlyctis nickersoniae]